jgi:iron complex transport system substrate-binding protein
MKTDRRRGPSAILLCVTVLGVLVGGVLAGATLGACGSGSASGAGASPAATTGPVTVKDDSGASVTLNHPATRIVSLAPANTEIAYAIGAGGKMVAGTSYDDYPAAAKSLPKIGDFANPSVEKIASFKPDLVLAAGGIQAGLRNKLEILGMQVYVVDPKSYGEVMIDIANLGTLAGTTDKAQHVIGAMKQAENVVKSRVDGLDKVPTFLEIYSKPLMTAGANTFIDDMIGIAGGTNIGAAAGSGYPNFSSEVLVKDDPAVYIADSGSMSSPGDITKRPGFAALRAVKEGHVYVIDDNLIARPGPRLAQGLQQLAKMIHPEAYTSQ